jgi:DNA polymerase
MIRTIDFETYYDKEYSLSKMQMDAYIYDPRFEIILVGIDNEWFSGTEDEVRQWILEVTNPNYDTFLAHHAQFDGFILSERLGIRPRRWLDTLSMARAALPQLKSHSLASLAKHFKLPNKGNEVHDAIGMHRADFNLHALRGYADYCLNDVDITRKLLHELRPITPSTELAIIDMTVRMFTEPQFVLDSSLLETCYTNEVKLKEELMQAACADKETLMSSAKFAKKLGEYISVPYKVTAKGNSIPAVAKSDKEFQALAEYPIPEVQALVAARLGVKTTIAETRALRMLETSRRGQGRFPVYLSYWGAKTTGRHSGGNKINAQNLPARGRGTEIRRALRAPPGHVVVVGDSSNIELRVAMACAGQSDAVEKLRANVDLYCDFASVIYGRTITEEDKSERQLGKVAMLSLQYGAGASKFREIVRLMAKRVISEQEAWDILTAYRSHYGKIKLLWRYCNDTVLPAIYNDQMLTPVDVHGWFLTSDQGFSRPGHPGVVYDKLTPDTFNGAWIYKSDKGDAGIYGGKVVENLCQHMARNVFLWQAAVIAQEYPVALAVHDEVVCVVPERKAKDAVAYIKHVLSTAPSWCGDKLPLSAKVACAATYGEAKT